MATMRLAIVGVVCTLVLIGCGGSESADAPAATVTVTAPAETATAQPDATEAAPTEAEVPAVEQGVVPEVVGMQHQLAQDTLQAAGFYNLSEEDATGAGRALVVDRNWIVVEQEPPGGTKAASDVTVVLRSKMIGE